MNQEAILGFGEMAQNNPRFLYYRWPWSKGDHHCNFHRSSHIRLGPGQIAGDCAVIRSI
jgi:hypothetical protein